MNEPKYPLTDIFVEDWCHWIQGASFLRFFMELKTQDMQSARLAVEPLHYNFPTTPPPSIKSVKNFRRVPGTDSDCTERSLRDPLKHCSPEKMCLRKSLFVFYRVFISRSTLFPMSSGRSSLIKIIPLPAECHEYLLVCLEIIEHRNLCQHFVFEMCRMVVWCLEVIW